MGDRAGFVARTKDGVKASEVKVQLEKRGGRGLFADDNLGLITGIIKSSYPGGCKIILMQNDLIESFASLSEKANSVIYVDENDDYFSKETL